MVTRLIFRIGHYLRQFGLVNPDASAEVQHMRQVLRDLGGISFTIDLTPDGGWVAESTNIDGIITGGKDSRRINAEVKDAIFTYFGVPPYLCDDSLLKGPNEVTFTEKVLATR